MTSINRLNWRILLELLCKIDQYSIDATKNTNIQGVNSDRSPAAPFAMKNRLIQAMPYTAGR